MQDIIYQAGPVIKLAPGVTHRPGFLGEAFSSVMSMIPQGSPAQSSTGLSYPTAEGEMFTLPAYSIAVKRVHDLVRSALEADFDLCTVLSCPAWAASPPETPAQRLPPLPPGARTARVTFAMTEFIAALSGCDSPVTLLNGDLMDFLPGSEAERVITYRPANPCPPPAPRGGESEEESEGDEEGGGPGPGPGEPPPGGLIVLTFAQVKTARPLRRPGW